MEETFAYAKYQELLYRKGYGHPFWVPAQVSPKLTVEMVRVTATLVFLRIAAASSTSGMSTILPTTLSI